MASQEKTYVPLQWHRISWLPGEPWSKTLQKIEKSGVRAVDLERCVYVIRLNGNICIKYPKGASPTVYIGEGNLKQRLKQHEKWTSELVELVGPFEFQVCITVPRVRKNAHAYKSVEAALINYFAVVYRTTPLWNKQFETETSRYIYSEKSFKEALNMGSGARYLWAIQPMKSSRFARVYDQNATGRKRPAFGSPP